MKKITILFDFEGWWEAPYRGKFDINKNTNRILRVLDRYKAKAVFNTCGVVAQFFPGLVKKIHEKGHEIASHGYRHENFIQLSSKELNNVLKKTEDIIKKITGSKLAGVRCPWLIHNKKVYSVIQNRGYKWVSNQYTPFPELFENPFNAYSLMDVHKLAKIVVKFQHMFFYPKKPIYKNSLLEIPLFSSMDADLLSLVSAEQKSPRILLDFALNTLKKQFNNSEKYFNLNFHPWLIGSSNRIILLDNILEYISNKDVNYVLAKDLTK